MIKMKNRIIDILVAFLIIGFLLLGFQLSKMEIPNKSIRLAAPFGTWDFKTVSGFTLKNVPPGDHVCSLLPSNEPCVGSYIGKLNLSDPRFQKLLNEVTH